MFFGLKMFFKTAWWEINQVACFCKLWAPGHLMGMAALQNSVGADFLKPGGEGWALFCAPVLFWFFKRKGFFNSSLLKSPCYQEPHDCCSKQLHKK